MQFDQVEIFMDNLFSLESGLIIIANLKILLFPGTRLIHHWTRRISRRFWAICLMQPIRCIGTYCIGFLL